MKQIPFNLELAEKIQNKDIKGEILTRGGKKVNVLKFDSRVLWYPIITLVEDENDHEVVISYTSKGEVRVDGPSSTRDLVLNVDEMYALEESDIVYRPSNGCMAMFYHYDDEKMTRFVTNVVLFPNGKLVTGEGYLETSSFVKANENQVLDFMKAIESEIKDDHDDSIKEIPDLKEEKPTLETGCFVLVRDKNNNTWELDIFSRINNNTIFPYKCVNGTYMQCITYKGNEHLLGTINSLE